MLVEIAKGRKLSVITSGGTGIEDSEAVRILMKGRKDYRVRPLVFLSIVALGLLALNFLVYSLLFAALAAGLVWSTYRHNRRRGSNIRVKVVTNRFIHEKMYLSDDGAITGSANLTFSGMHRNIEHIDMVNDREKVRGLLGHFEELWSRY
jgi:phosphatidylserine/phosphatidylglycerophosphate/cardiolipin synthase-like enzyme